MAHQPSTHGPGHLRGPICPTSGASFYGRLGSAGAAPDAVGDHLRIPRRVDLVRWLWGPLQAGLAIAHTNFPGLVCRHARLKRILKHYRRTGLDDILRRRSCSVWRARGHTAGRCVAIGVPPAIPRASEAGVQDAGAHHRAGLMRVQRECSWWSAWKWMMRMRWGW